MAKDVFVSHSTHDKIIAEKLCMVLEELGIDCWIAPRDIPSGAEFDVSILDGIDQCQAIIVILSAYANASLYVKNEVNRAFSGGKAILTFRVEDINPAKALEFYLARHQWTDGFPPPVEERIARMAKALLELIGRPSQETERAMGGTRLIPYSQDWNHASRIFTNTARATTGITGNQQPNNSVRPVRMPFRYYDYS